MDSSLAGPGRPHQALSAGYQRPRQSSRVPQALPESCTEAARKSGLQQELILGIGGWRLMRALGILPEVCHLNEGHAAFAVLERAADYMQQTSQPFSTGVERDSRRQLFTTHTPVEAGFDRFPADLIRTHFGHYADTRLHISMDQLLALGRSDPHNGGEPFNMAYLAVRCQRRGEWREPPARRSEPQDSVAAFPTLAGARSASPSRDQRRPYFHLGFRWRRRPLDGGLRQRRLARRS